MLRVGMGQPYAVHCTVAASADFDPQAVTAAVFVVTKPSGATAVWPATLANASASSVEAFYALRATTGPSDVGDIDEHGTWLMWIQWTQAGNAPGPRSEPIQFPVGRADR
jgi:hypothetical protein